MRKVKQIISLDSTSPMEIVVLKEAKGNLGVLYFDRNTTLRLLAYV